ncbi:MAG: response regulator [Methyloprofundus sp.]|nr:response regulator [Methyloprofundus sp.]
MLNKSDLLEQRLNQLNQDYVDSLPEKIRQIEMLWRGLVKHDLGTQDLKLLYQCIHSLNGSGATFGYTILSEIAAIIEILLKPLMQTEQLPTIEQQSHISTLLIKLRKAALEPKGHAIRHDLVAPTCQGGSPIDKNKVFIVDDDEAVAKKLAQKLEQYHYDSEIFLSLAGVKERVIASPPIAIIMDIVFPEGELAGTDVIADIKRSQLLPIPVIFISVRDDMTAHLSAVRAGATHYLSKPVNANHLMSLLNDLTEKINDDPYRVMIVDDDVALSNHFSLTLEHAGLSTNVVTDPMRVLDELKAYQPELILMDVYMPECSGLELAIIIRQFPEFNDVPILFLSAETNFDKQLAALDMGGDDFLSKPIEPRHLVNAVLTRVRRYRKTNLLAKNLRGSISRLAISEKRLSQIINTSPAAIYTLQVSENTVCPLNVTMMSDSIESICGYTAKEWLAKESFWLDIIHKDDKEQVFNAIKGLFDQGRLEHEYRIEHKNGELLWVHENLTVLEDRSGHIIEIIGSRMDISEIKHNELKRIELEEQLRQTHKMEAIGLLTGGIAHDFNNILASILGYASLANMRGGFTPESKVTSYIQQIINAGERGRLLTSQMLSFCRNIQTEAACIQIEPLIRETIKLLQSTLPSSIEFHVDVDEGLPDIQMDPTQLHQIMMNLCVNAKDAMQGKGCLSIKLKLVELTNQLCTTCKQGIEGQFIELSVADTGAGITKASIERIFDPFYTSKPIGKGAGIGLSIVHGVVHQNQGHVVLQSFLGKGSQFNLYFTPKEGEKIMGTCGDNNHTEIHKGQGESILVVDDEEGIVELLRETLDSLEYSVTATASSVDALAMFKESPEQFDLIITDQTMPVITGDELIKEVRQLRADIPIILCTGYSESMDPVLAKEIGVDQFFYKPFQLEKLLESVYSLLLKHNK